MLKFMIYSFVRFDVIWGSLIGPCQLHLSVSQFTCWQKKANECIFCMWCLLWSNGRIKFIAVTSLLWFKSAMQFFHRTRTLNFNYYSDLFIDHQQRQTPTDFFNPTYINYTKRNNLQKKRKPPWWCTNMTSDGYVKYIIEITIYEPTL
jgi:hypothetical protein